MIVHTKPKMKEEVLKLPQSTQTENRSFIKYLLTLINEAIMRRIEHQSIQMSKDEFKDAID